MNRSKATRIAFIYVGAILIIVSIIVAATYWKITKNWQGDVFDQVVAEQTTHQVIPVLIVLGGLLAGGVVIWFGIVKTSRDESEIKESPNPERS